MNSELRRASAGGIPSDADDFYRQIIQSAQEGVIVLDAELRYIVWNPFMERVMGVPAEQIIGKRTIDVFPQLEAAGIIEAQQQALQGHSQVLPDVLVTSPHDRRQYWFSLHYSPLRSQQQEIAGVICIVRDISERKRVEEQFRHAQKMEAVGRLAGGIAHDFNNLLMAINGYASVALGAPDVPDHLLVPLREILSAGERATALTHQLLAYTRKQILTPETWQLNAIVSGVQRILERVLGEDIEVVSQLRASPGWVKVDRVQVEQIILNLAVNARDAMQGGGTLTIDTLNVTLDDSARPGQYVMLAVSDTGTGMAPDVQAQLFEPFFTTKEPGKGTGLGLSTVYGIVKQSGGRIEVHSELGRGTTFRIYFPEASSPPSEAITTTSKACPLLTGSETVLVVEDQEVVRRLTCQILGEMAGYTIHSASNGREALRLLDTEQLDVALVITDIVMPEMGGRELSAILRSRPNPPEILYMSACAPPTATLRNDIGAEHYLQKPFEPRALLSKVRAILDERACAKASIISKGGGRYR